MKYAKSDLAMDIVLPDDVAGLSKLESSMSAGTFATWTSSLHSDEVSVSVPKVQFTWGRNMNAPLKALGMKTAFDDKNADFTGIASPAAAGGNLYVSDVFHKAFVALDEQGTEAAAATGVVVAHPTAVMLTQTFKADHPFLFAIRDTKSGRILFMGRVTDPRG
jgi:serpin B